MWVWWRLLICLCWVCKQWFAVYSQQLSIQLSSINCMWVSSGILRNYIILKEKRSICGHGQVQSSKLQFFCEQSAEGMKGWTNRIINWTGTFPWLSNDPESNIMSHDLQTVQKAQHNEGQWTKCFLTWQLICQVIAANVPGQWNCVRATKPLLLLVRLAIEEKS